MSLQNLLNFIPKPDEDNQTRMEMLEMMCALPLDKWLKFCENESKLVFSFVQTHDIQSFYDNNGWFQIYKCILEKYPERYLFLPTDKAKFCFGGKDKYRLTQEQYDELKEMGKQFTEEAEAKKEQLKKKRMEDFRAAISAL